MKILTFMDAHKCPKLAKHYSNKVLRMVDEMMTRLDDFVRPEEAFASTELPKEEALEAPYQAHKDQGPQHPRVNLNSLTKLPKEILASELQLSLQPPRPMPLPPKKENQDKYCDYHGEKGHDTNDCFQLKRQIEIALESGKLNHLIKDVRQRGQGNTKGRDAGKDKIINMIRSWPDDKKRKLVERGESWMKAPIVFPPLSMEDTSDEPLIIEAIMDGVKSPPSIFLNNTLHGKVPHIKRDRNYGHPDRDHIRVLEAGKKANGQDGGQSKYPTRGRRSRKSGPDRANTGQPIISGPASDDKGKPLGR
ncbi:hypothetical protein Tco_1098179, partial [Tanacetum coccineum]